MTGMLMSMNIAETALPASIIDLNISIASNPFDAVIISKVFSRWTKVTRIRRLISLSSTSKIIGRDPVACGVDCRSGAIMEFSLDVRLETGLVADIDLVPRASEAPAC